MECGGGGGEEGKISKPEQKGRSRHGDDFSIRLFLLN